MTLDPKLDPRKLDPTRGFERDSADWTVFGLSVDPDLWASIEQRDDVEQLWAGSDPSSRDDAGVLHGLIVGARAHLRELVKRAITVERMAWAELGGVPGHYAMALMLEGARSVRLIAEVEPGATARRLLDALRVEVVVGDVHQEPLVGISHVLALHAIDPLPRLHRRIDVVVHTAVGEGTDLRGREHEQRVREHGGLVRRITLSSPFVVADATCRFGKPASTRMEIWTRGRRWHEPRPCNSIRSVGDALTTVLGRLTADDCPPRDVGPIADPSPNQPTGSVPFDVCLGGLKRGRVHLVVSSSANVRTAVLADLATARARLDGSGVLFAGLAAEHELIACVLASATGISRDALGSGALHTRDWTSLIAFGAQHADLPMRFTGRVRVANDLDRKAFGTVSVVTVDLDDIEPREFFGWQWLAAREHIPVVLGVDPRSPALERHTFPELRLARIAVGRDRSRMACRGLSIGGAPSRRLVVDVDHRTLAMRAYDPANEGSRGEVPADEELMFLPEECWVTTCDGTVL